jgi:hypothetical protein
MNGFAPPRSGGADISDCGMRVVLISAVVLVRHVSASIFDLSGGAPGKKRVSRPMPAAALECKTAGTAPGKKREASHCCRAKF